MTFFRLVIFTFLITLSCNANANRIQDTLYFELSTGQEIRVEVTGDAEFPRLLIYNNSDHSDSYVFKEYVKAARDRQGYRYIDLAPCENCYTSRSLIYSALLQLAQESDEAIQPLGSDSTLKSSQSGYSTENVGKGSSSDYVSTSVNAIVTPSTKVPVDEIVNIILNNKNAETSPFHILRSKHGYPISLSVVVENGIVEALEDVVFTRIDGGWSAEYPATVDTINPNEYSKRAAIETAIQSFIADSSLSILSTNCTFGYAGSNGSIKVQKTCYIAK